MTSSIGQLVTPKQMWLPIYMIRLDLTFNISHPAAKKSIFCLFVCFSKCYLYTSKAFLISHETKFSAIRHFRRRKLDQVNFRKGFWNCYQRQREKGPLQLAIYVVQNLHAGEQKSHWDKTNEGYYHLKLCVPFVCLVPVRLSLASMVVLQHVSCQLQRACWPIAGRRVPNSDPRSNCGTNLGSSSLVAFIN